MRDITLGQELNSGIIWKVFSEIQGKLIQHPIDLTGRKYYGFRQNGCLVQFNEGEIDKLTH
jgi:hypothetical protein